jgi:hypothetical protein
MEMLDGVRDSRQMELITDVAKRFTIWPNPVVEPERTTFKAFTTIETI